MWFCNQEHLEAHSQPCSARRWQRGGSALMGRSPLLWPGCLKAHLSSGQEPRCVLLCSLIQKSPISLFSRVLNPWEQSISAEFRPLPPPGSRPCRKGEPICSRLESQLCGWGEHPGGPLLQAGIPGPEGQRRAWAGEGVARGVHSADKAAHPDSCPGRHLPVMWPWTRSRRPFLFCEMG